MKDEAETILVFIDTTTTDHYYSVTTTTEELTTTYEAAEVTPCVQEIGRLPPRKYQIWDRNFKKYLKLVHEIIERNEIELNEKQEREIQELLSKFMYELGSDNIGVAQIKQVAKSVMLMGDDDIKPENIKLDVNQEVLKLGSSQPEDIVSDGKEL